jgi:hypothetical protein
MHGEEEIRARHRWRIETEDLMLRNRLVDFAEELLIRFWPRLRKSVFGESDLENKGLPSKKPEGVHII